MAFTALIGTTKKYYEQKVANMKGIDEFFFKEKDTSTATTVEIDRYLGTGYSTGFIDNNGQADTRYYEAGSNQVVTPPIFKEQTPIDQDLSDSVIVGVNANADAQQHASKLVKDITMGPKGLVNGVSMLQRKTAIDLMREGKFTCYDNETGKIRVIDFERDASLTSLTADFSSVSFDEALLSAINALMPFGFNANVGGVLLGSDWLKQFNTDSKVLEKRKATQAQFLIDQSQLGQPVDGVEGLYMIGTYTVDGTATPVKLYTYTPRWQYRNKKGEVSNYMPSDEALVFEIGGSGWKFNRGVNVLDSNGKATREAGDIIFDSYTNNNPVADFIRANGRFMYAPYNVNASAKIVGSNFGS